MLKTFALVGFAAALVLSPAASFAVSGNSSSYGTNGYGPKVSTQSLTAVRSVLEQLQSKQEERAG